MNFAVIASFIFGYLIFEQKIEILEYFRNTTNQDYMKNVFKETLNHKDKYRYNEDIDVILESNDTIECLYKLKITYDYQTLITSPDINFSFFRIYEKDKLKEYTGLSSSLLKNEFYWVYDESNLEDNLIQEDAYIVSNLLIIDENNTKYDLELIKSPTIDLGYGMHVHYYVKLPKLNSNVMARLMYTISVPYKTESYLNLHHQFPTHRAKVKFDYSKVAEQITVSSIPITGPVAANYISSVEENHKITYVYNGWLMPKNGYIFVWWQNHLFTNCSSRIKSSNNADTT